MRILNAMFGRGQGGIEQAIVDYSEALQYCGHEAIACVHPHADIIPALSRCHIEVLELPNFGAWDPIATWRLKRLIRRTQPDVCIAHGNRAISLLKAAKTTVIVGVMHNYKINYEGLPYVFYPTQDLLRYCEAKPMRDTHFYPVPNMVRVPRDRLKREWHKPPIIGSMGRFVAKKGFIQFIEALAELKKRNVTFKAMLAGEGEDSAELKNLSIAKGLGNLLHFPGWVEDKQAFYDAVDIFCLPSLHEPFGIVLLEAMAQALPIVSTRSEGPSEILGDGIDGILVDVEKPMQLADALEKLLVNRQQADLLAQNAYDTVKSRYDLPMVARKLDLALRSLHRL